MCRGWGPHQVSSPIALCLVSDTGSLAEAKEKMSGSPRNPPASNSSVLGLWAAMATFYMGAENQIWVFMLSQQSLYQLSHLPSP